ncbi:MAG: lysylphosphatidylglycerol synthase transmembrane domain-containing protein [Erysipelotrichaceae bacterium]
MQNKSYRSYIINIALIVLCSGGITYLLLHDQWQDVLSVLQSVHFWPFVLVLLYAQLTMLCSGSIISSIVKVFHKNYRLKDGLLSTLVFSFFSGITPSATGGQFGQLYVFSKQGIHLAKGASILWYDFICYQIVMIAFVAGLLGVQMWLFPDWNTPFDLLIYIGFVIQASIVLLLLAMAFMPNSVIKVAQMLLNATRRFFPVAKREKWERYLIEQVTDCQTHIAMFSRNYRLLGKVLAMNVLKLLTYYSVPIMVCLAMGIKIEPMLFIQLLSLTAFVSMAAAFFPVPGASGGTEMIFTLLATPLIGNSIAMAVMVIWRLTTYYATTLIGGVAFVSYRFIKRQPQM